MSDQLLAFIPKIYFPGRIFLGDKSSAFFKTIQDDKKLVVVSDVFQEKNKDLLPELFGSEQDYFSQEREPTVEDFEKLKVECQRISPKYIIAFGGGSVIDLAKLAKRELKIDMVAVPTTLGSGAEVSQHALLIENGNKKVFSSHDLLPEVVIINPAYLTSLSQEQIIYQAIDALSHGLESLVSRMSNQVSDSLSLMALESLYRNLENLNKEDERVRAIEEIQIAALFAGFAQSSAATGLLHAFAHYFGAKQNIPHVKAVATFFLDVLELNSKNTDKYEKLNQLKDISKDNFVPKLKDILTKLEVKPADISISEKELEEVAESIRKDISTLSNPFSPTTEDIKGILSKYTK